MCPVDDLAQFTGQRHWFGTASDNSHDLYGGSPLVALASRIRLPNFEGQIMARKR